MPQYVSDADLEPVWGTVRKFFTILFVLLVALWTITDLSKRAPDGFSKFPYQQWLVIFQASVLIHYRVFFELKKVRRSWWERARFHSALLGAAIAAFAVFAAVISRVYALTNLGFSHLLLAFWLNAFTYLAPMSRLGRLFEDDERAIDELPVDAPPAAEFQKNTQRPRGWISLTIGLVSAAASYLLFFYLVCGT